MVSQEEQMFWASCELENWPADQPVVGWSSGVLVGSLFYVASLQAGWHAVALLEE